MKLSKEQVILAVLNKADSITFNELNKEQVILAILTEEEFDMRFRRRTPLVAVRNLLAVRNLPPV